MGTKAYPRGGVKTNRSLKLAHTAAVTAGDVIISNGQVFIACNDADHDVATSYIFKGPVSFPKVTGTALVPGDAIYFDPIVEKAAKAQFTAHAAVAGTNTGTGNVSDLAVDVSAVAETWTLTCKVSGTAFTVVGSVSGAKADATVGAAYDNNYVNFKINQGTGDGAVNFAENDSFTIAVTAGTKCGICKEAAGSSATTVLVELNENK